MPISEKQFAANRANATKSTGPRTPEGKARSSRNSTVHGLTGKSPILPGEDPGDLRALVAQYRDALHPQGQVEEDLVGWQPRLDDLSTIVAHALAWQKKLITRNR